MRWCFQRLRAISRSCARERGRRRRVSVAHGGLAAAVADDGGMPTAGRGAHHVGLIVGENARANQLVRRGLPLQGPRRWRVEAAHQRAASRGLPSGAEQGSAPLQTNQAQRALNFEAKELALFLLHCGRDGCERKEKALLFSSRRALPDGGRRHAAHDRARGASGARAGDCGTAGGPYDAGRSAVWARSQRLDHQQSHPDGGRLDAARRAGL